METVRILNNDVEVVVASEVADYHELDEQVTVGVLDAVSIDIRKLADMVSEALDQNP